MQFTDAVLGDADTWGGPMNGVDLVEESGADPVKEYRMSPDLWAMLIILGAIGGLWFLGGIVFRKVNIF